MINLKQKDFIDSINIFSISKQFSVKLKKWKVSLVYRFAPFLILNKQEFAVYKILCKRLKWNYKNILNTDSKFFYKHLKSHIEWVSSKSFIESYGDFIALCKDERLDITKSLFSNNLDSNKDSKNIESKSTNNITPPPVSHSNIESTNHNTFKDSKNPKDSKFSQNKASNFIHPFPPLLNPNSINYETTPPALAYHLNLPLPQNYNFVYFSNGSSASAANLYYFEISHALTNPYWLGDCEKYIKDYTLLLHHKNEYIFLSFHPLVSTKNLFLFNKKVDMYYIARDPIEKLQHGINHTENGLIDEEIAKNPLSKRFNLTCDYNNLFVTPFYRLGSKVPQMQALDDEWIYKSYIAFSSYLKIWRNLGLINNVYCVDFKDFSKEKAFDTFAKVANHFHFTPPSDKKIFNDRINRNRGVLINLPTTLVAANSDIANAFCNGSENTQNLASLDSKDSLNIHIGTYQDFITNGSFIDISSEFFTEKIIIDKTQILIFMLKSEYFILRENALLLKACKNYLHGYIDTLKNKVKETQSHLISEDSIIEYLRNNKTLREKIKNIMDVELSFFKENYPQMVASWEYYQKFEAMCKGMRHYEQSNPNNGDSKTDSNNFIESKNLDSIENIESKNLQNPKLDSKNIIESKTITPPPLENDLQDKAYWENYYKTHSSADKESLFASFCLHNFFKPKLVELGCGNGRDSIYFAKNGLDVLGIDMCENEIALLAKNNPNVRFKCADFTRLDFMQELKDIDIIYSRFTLHSITQEQENRLFAWIVANLKSNGLFCIEARGLKNSLYKKGKPVSGEKNAFIYNSHFRRFLDFEMLCENLKSHFKILYAKEEKNFAPYKDENDYFIRIIARKN